MKMIFARKSLWRLGTTAATLTLILLLSVTPVLAKADNFASSQVIPIDLVVFVPCAAGGAGELVELTGTLHDLFVFTIDKQGGTHVKYLDNPQGITGTGLTTGDKYQGTGGTQGSFNSKVGSQDTFVNNFRIIGQGNGNNFLVHETFHVTINANGELTASVDNFSAECK